MEIDLMEPPQSRPPQQGPPVPRVRCWRSRLIRQLSTWLGVTLGPRAVKDRGQISLEGSGKIVSEGGFEDGEETRVSFENGLVPLSTLELGTTETRDTWSGKFQFFLSCMGYCVGFGNIWRFPFLVYRNGGGAFLIPYVIFLVLCGIPLVFMEMVLGQFSSLTPIHLFGKFSPICKGIGYSMVTISFLVCIYYNTILSWVIYYLYSSFQWVLPWTMCDPAWASELCFTRSLTEFVNDSVSNLTDIVDIAPIKFLNDSLSNLIDIVVVPSNRSQIIAAEEFWNRHVLRLSSGVDVLGSIRPELAICLAFAWITVFLCSFKGIQSSGKVVYVTATCPLIMLVVLLVRGCTLPGALEGIKLFIYPDFARLAHLQVWIDAAMQVFYAMAPGWGGLMSFASYNSFHVDVYKYGVAIPILNFMTSMLGGFAVFSIIGYLSYQSGIPVDKVVAHGPGLTFVAYPEALSQLPFAPLWSVLFFLTLFTIGIDSQFGMFETFLSAIIDEFPVLKKHRAWCCAGACSLLFCLGLICVTEAGMYWVQIIDWYCAFLTLLVICFIECLLVGWVYGNKRFEKDIESMIGYRIGPLWGLCWKYLTPVTIFGLLVCSIYLQTPIVYEKYTFPKWSVGLGWTLAISSVLPIPAYAVYVLFKKEKIGNRCDGKACENYWAVSIWRRFWRSVQATPEYGPMLPEDRLTYLGWREPLKNGVPLLKTGGTMSEDGLIVV